jgi:hypothetical protein
MNTVDIKVKASDVQEFAKDLKRMKIRHYPFQWRYDGYLVKLYPNPKIIMLRLKYGY